jgi:hypothetical protein
MTDIEGLRGFNSEITFGTTVLMARAPGCRRAPAWQRAGGDAKRYGRRRQRGDFRTHRIADGFVRTPGKLSGKPHSTRRASFTRHAIGHAWRAIGLRARSAGVAAAMPPTRRGGGEAAELTTARGLFRRSTRNACQSAREVVNGASNFVKRASCRASRRRNRFDRKIVGRHQARFHAAGRSAAQHRHVRSRNARATAGREIWPPVRRRESLPGRSSLRSQSRLDARAMAARRRHDRGVTRRAARRPRRGASSNASSFATRLGRIDGPRSSRLAFGAIEFVTHPQQQPMARRSSARSSPGGNQRQGQALGRQHAEVHAHRHERLQADPQSDAEGT